MKNRYKAALLAATFYAGAYTAVALPPTSYTFAGRSILLSTARFATSGDALEVAVSRNAECTLVGTVGAAFKDVYDEKTQEIRA